MAGLYRAVVATTMRQGGNSAVRMGSYSWLKGEAVLGDLCCGKLMSCVGVVQARQIDPNASLGTGTTFGIGALAGIITV